MTLGLHVRASHWRSGRKRQKTCWSWRAFASVAPPPGALPRGRSVQVMSVQLTSTIREIPAEPAAKDLDLDALQTSAITVEGATYEDAHAALVAATPEGWQRLGIYRD